MFKYQFYISCDIDGHQVPFMTFSPDKSVVHLGNLSHGHMSKSDGVRKELERIEEVLNGNKEVHSFGGDDWCIVDFRKKKSTIINGFDEFEPFEIESQLIYKLLQDWHEFLLAYENGKIPGIIHPDKRESI